MPPTLKIIQGDLLDHIDVDAIVNAWNRNIFPWWLLLPQGVSRAIKQRAGLEPFRQLAKMKPIPLGQAVLTSPGLLPCRAIIHVAGINLLWRASPRSISDSVQSAIALAHTHHFTSLAMPLIGAGSGGFSPARSLEIMQQAALSCESFHGEVRIVCFDTQKS